MDRSVGSVPRKAGFLSGTCFCGRPGTRDQFRKIRSFVFGSLGVLQDHQRWEQEQGDDLEGILIGVDIPEVYGISRSFKRGAITRAQEAGVSQPDVDFMGRWRTVERAAGRKPGRSMREHYTELVQMLDARLRFSKAL
jgi:hypothetical protein